MNTYHSSPSSLPIFFSLLFCCCLYECINHWGGAHNSDWEKKVNVHTDAYTLFPSVPLPVVCRDPQLVTWHECTNWKPTARSLFWHFSKLPTVLIPHPLHQTINSLEELERRQEMDTLTDNNEFPIVHTHTHACIPQPPSSYCVPPNYSRPLHTVPGQQFSLPWGTTEENRNEKVTRQRAQLELLEWDLGQSAAGCSLKVKVKVGQGEHQEENLSPGEGIIFF